MERGPFRSYSGFLRERYGTAVYRIAVDPGFSCPHRRENGTGGCTYCHSSGSRAPYLGDLAPVKSQILGAERFLRRRYGATRFILYFQAHTATYAPVDRLKEIYDHALSVRPFEEMIVSTRPDCLSEEVAALLASYRGPNRDVWVELGVQSMHEESLLRVNRRHGVEDSLRAVERLRGHGLKIAPHLIFGLPGEDEQRILESVQKVAALRPDGIKIHNLHVVRRTPLAGDYERGEVVVPGPEEHMELVVEALRRLPEQTVVMRLTTDTPADLLVAPRFFWDKALFYRLLRREMERRGVRQGDLFPRDAAP